MKSIVAYQWDNRRAGGSWRERDTCVPYRSNRRWQEMMPCRSYSNLGHTLGCEWRTSIRGTEQTMTSDSWRSAQSFRRFLRRGNHGDRDCEWTQLKWERRRERCRRTEFRSSLKQPNNINYYKLFTGRWTSADSSSIWHVTKKSIKTPLRSLHSVTLLFQSISNSAEWEGQQKPRSERAPML